MGRGLPINGESRINRLTTNTRLSYDSWLPKPSANPRWVTRNPTAPRRQIAKAAPNTMYLQLLPRTLFCWYFASSWEWTFSSFSKMVWCSGNCPHEISWWWADMGRCIIFSGVDDRQPIRGFWWDTIIGCSKSPGRWWPLCIIGWIPLWWECSVTSGNPPKQDVCKI